tara:strand:+ start:305 stop:532 length:228 start_codon:yes stop_codon:yes gene_type:complete
MSLPMVSFKEFVKNPIVALLFICLMAIGYLYVDNKTTLTTQIEVLRKDLEGVKKDNKSLNAEIRKILLKVNTNQQ